MTSNLEILCQKFIDINKNYTFPKFIYYYKNINKNQNGYDIFIFNSEKLNSNNEFALNSVKREIKTEINYINKSKNVYNNFCIKTITVNFVVVRHPNFLLPYELLSKK